MRSLSYAGYRFPHEIIQHAIWLYLRFTLSFRDVEELLAERGIDVSHETVRRWVAVFGPMIAQRLSTRERLCDKTTGQRARTFRCDDESERCNASGQVGSAQRFLSAHASVYNTFNICRHLLTSATKRRFRTEAFEIWRAAAGVAA